MRCRRRSVWRRPAQLAALRATVGLPIATALGVGIALAVWGRPAAISDAGSVSSSAPAVAAIYQRDCATCHGATGSGTTRGPRIAGVGTAMVDYMLSTGRMPIVQPTDHLATPPPRLRRGHPPGAGRLRRRRSLRAGPPIPDRRSGPCRSRPGQPAVPARLRALPLGGRAAAARCWISPRPICTNRHRPKRARRCGPAHRPCPSSAQAALTGRQLDDVVAYVQYLRHPDNRGGFSLDHLGPLPEGAVALVFGLGVLICVTILIERRRRT